MHQSPHTTQIQPTAFPEIFPVLNCYVMCLLRNCMLFLLLTLVSFKSFSSAALSFNLSSDCIVTADIEEFQFPGVWVINVELKDAEAEVLEVLTRDNINESFIFIDDNGKGLTLEPVNLIHALSKNFSIAAYNSQSEAEGALQRIMIGAKKCSMRAR